MPSLRTLLLAVCSATVLAGPPAVAGAEAGRPDAAGVTDSTSALQALIDRTPDGGVVRLDEGADYRVEGTVVVADRHDLRIEGNGARLFATTVGGPSRSHLRVVGGSGIAVRDLEIEGANPHAGLDDRAYRVDLEGQHGIRLEGVGGVELDGVQVHDTFGDLVYVGRHEDRRWSERVWIHDSTFRRSGRQGISVTAGRDVVVERNRISDTRRASIDLEPNSPSWGAENVHVLDNEIGPGRLLFVAAGGRGPVGTVVVARNDLQGHILNVWVETPPGQRRRAFWVVDNTSDTPASRAPLRFVRVDGVVVTGNRQPIDRHDQSLVETDGACGVSVSGNDTAPGAIGLAGGGHRCRVDLPASPPEPPDLADRDGAQSRSAARGGAAGPPWVVWALSAAAVACAGAGAVIRVRSARR